MNQTLTLPAGVEIKAPVDAQAAQILTPDAVRFLAKLARQFEPTRQQLLARRIERQKEIDAGAMPDFLPSTRQVREGKWKVAPVPADLQDRRIEITGPVDRKMIINALNSGAKVFMADCEDANSPTWRKTSKARSTCAMRCNRDDRFHQPRRQEVRA